MMMNMPPMSVWVYQFHASHVLNVKEMHLLLNSFCTLKFDGYALPKAESEPTSNWKEHTTPDGRVFYYNSLTNESRWEKPDEMKKNDSDVGFW